MIIKKILFGKIKEYGNGLLKTHISKDFNTLYHIAHGYTETFQPATRAILRRILDVAKQSLDEYADIKKEEKEEKTVIDTEYRVEDKQKRES